MLQSNFELWLNRFLSESNKITWEDKGKWSDLAQLGTEWRAINVYMR